MTESNICIIHKPGGWFCGSSDRKSVARGDGSIGSSVRRKLQHFERTSRRMCPVTKETTIVCGCGCVAKKLSALAKILAMVLGCS